MKYCLSVLFVVMASAASAQAPKTVPVDELSGGEGALLHGQQRAGMAYRQLEQARYEAKLAGQEHLNAEDAYRAARDRADELKRQAEAAKKALDAAKAKEAAARKAYENALNAVDQLRASPGK